MSNAQVYKSVDLPDGAGRVVIFDRSTNTGFCWKNLVCLDGNGDVVWAAELPENTDPDFFVGVNIDGGTIRAGTWSGYAVALDPRTEKNLNRIFTK